MTKIKMKTRNITQSRAHNDPINYQMHGYSFRDFWRWRWHSRCDFSLLPRSIFYFKHSSDVKMCQEKKEIEWRLNWGV